MAGWIAAAIHKSDVGGVALGIKTPQTAAQAMTAIRAALAEAGIAAQAGEFLVQEHISDLNPVFVRQHGTVVADIRVRLTG